MRKVLHDKYGAMIIIGILSLVLDQVTKSMIIARFPRGGSLPVIDGFFELYHTHNDAAAFGLFGGNSVTFFLIVSCFAIAFIFYYFIKLERTDVLLAASLAMILGGALGNIIDRIRHGFVIDFLRFYLGEHSWPTFNVADIAIVCGVAVFALDMIRQERKSALEKGA